jgi:2-methylisocitrate lyase-like PEP mutase family enzyme
MPRAEISFMTTDVAIKRARFRALHREGCFVIPNPWDIGSAKRLECMGFLALASTSSGSAWAMGLEDGQLSRDQVLEHLTRLCAATNLPINADFEAGFAASPEELADNVLLAVETGVAGLSIEDYDQGRLYNIAEAAGRIRAARKAIDRSGQDVLLVGRAEGFIRGMPDLDDTIRRLVAYSEAGADCLYTPGVKDLAAIRRIVEAVAPKPVNVLMNGPELRVSELAAVGVRRVSVGGALARAAWSAFERAAQMLHQEGTLPARQ